VENAAVAGITIQTPTPNTQTLNPDPSEFDRFVTFSRRAEFYDIVGIMTPTANSDNIA